MRCFVSAKIELYTSVVKRLSIPSIFDATQSQSQSGYFPCKRFHAHSIRSSFMLSEHDAFEVTEAFTDKAAK